jgi:hypothetical protein
VSTGLLKQIISSEDACGNGHSYPHPRYTNTCFNEVSDKINKLNSFIVYNNFWIPSPSSQLRRACVCGNQNWTSKRRNFSQRPAGNLVSNHEPRIQRENWSGREADHSLPSNAATVSIIALRSHCNSCWTARELSHSFSRRRAVSDTPCHESCKRV